MGAFSRSFFLLPLPPPLWPLGTFHIVLGNYGSTSVVVIYAEYWDKVGRETSSSTLLGIRCIGTRISGVDRNAERSFSVCGLRVGWAVVIGLIPDIGDFANVILAYLVVQRKARQAEFPNGRQTSGMRNLLEEFLKAQTGGAERDRGLRCWHILLLFRGWYAMVCLINQHLIIRDGVDLVLCSVSSFHIPRRPSFERYHEGRTLWSQIVFASRTFARAVWFHVPDDAMPNVPDLTNEERKSRTLIEKKTVINLLEAYAVHHLPSRNATLFHRTVKDALAVGLTSIHEASTDLDAVEFYKHPTGYWGNKLPRLVDYGIGGRLNLRSIKLFVDGFALLFWCSPAGNTTIRPRAESCESGKTFPLTSSKDSTPMTGRWRVPTLAGSRPRIEHAQVMTSEDLERMGWFGAIPNVQPTHAHSALGLWTISAWPSRVNAVQLETTLPATQTLVRTPLQQAWSDSSLIIARRRVPSWNDLELLSRGFALCYLEQRSTRFHALQGMTLGAAYASFSESVTGSLAMGKRADFVVLDRDITTVPEPEILVTKVLATFIDGEVVYKSL
ncbi:hypothetical protein F5141DRAFT_1061779 [Pisolithus sp. B1]|nr:hypothetical protein F5141DRAFT_1061779 [Pisolithus sp. B1]